MVLFVLITEANLQFYSPFWRLAGMTLELEGGTRQPLRKRAAVKEEDFTKVRVMLNVYKDWERLCALTSRLQRDDCE